MTGVPFDRLSDRSAAQGPEARATATPSVSQPVR